MSAIGIMDGAYFVGRNELLQWINSTLGLNLSKIEQTASGAVACQLLDALHPGCVALAKVDFNAKNDYEYINNYKILQAAFAKLGIDKHIEVNKLIRARPLDNIEFMQWLKSYFDSHSNGQNLNYDAAARRAASKTGGVKGSSGKARIPLSSATTTANVNGAVPARSTSISKKNPGTRQFGQAVAAPAAAVSSGSQDTAMAAQVQEAAEQVTELKLKVDNVERERDFYFDKLRDIEILCQMPLLQSIPVVKVFERILYAADEKEAKEAMEQVLEEYNQQSTTA
ncbi:hypothetical protein ABBQ38_000450 [Trebouxia sp. C0009 RCD-2024]